MFNSIRVRHANLLEFFRRAHIHDSHVIPSFDALPGYAGSNPLRYAVELVQKEMSGPGNGIDRGKIWRRIAEIDTCDLIHGSAEEKGACSDVKPFGGVTPSHHLEAEELSRTS